MNKLPKLKIRTMRELKLVEEVLDINQAQHLFYSEAHILVEGQRMLSHDELVKLAAQEEYSNREFLEVVLLPLEAAAGG